MSQLQTLIIGLRQKQIVQYICFNILQPVLQMAILMIDGYLSTFYAINYIIKMPKPIIYPPLLKENNYIQFPFFYNKFQIRHGHV